MAKYIDLNSYYRNFEAYPNPANFSVAPEQVNRWIPFPRSISGTYNTNATAQKFHSNIKLKYVIIPYTMETANFNRIYVLFGTEPFGKYYISGMNQSLLDVPFVAEFSRFQHDYTGDIKWIHFVGNDINQVIPFDHQKTPIFRLYTPEGLEIVLEDEFRLPENQVTAFFEAVPYNREDEFLDKKVK